MKPSFALDLASDGVRLLHRTALGWRCVGEAALDAPDLAQQIAALRSTALGLSPEGLTTRLVIPNNQVLYRKVHAPGPDVTLRRRQIRAALEGMTPYAPEELAYDWTGDGDEVQVALVARETLEEAEAFAADSRFTPVAFVAIPEPGQFDGEPFFGQTHLATAMLPQGERVERESGPMRLLDPPKPPKRPAPKQAPQAPVEGPDSPPDLQPPAPDLPVPGPDALPEQPQEEPPAVAPDLPGPSRHEIPGQPQEDRPTGVLSGHVEEGHEAHPSAPAPQEDDPLAADIRALAAPRAPTAPAEARTRTPLGSTPSGDSQVPPRAHSALARLGLKGADDISPATTSAQTLDPVRPRRRQASMRTGLLLTAGLLILIVILLLGSGIFLNTRDTGRGDEPSDADRRVTAALSIMAPLASPAAAEPAPATTPVAATKTPETPTPAATLKAMVEPTAPQERPVSLVTAVAAPQPQEPMAELRRALAAARLPTLKKVAVVDWPALALVDQATAPSASARPKARPGGPAPLTSSPPAGSLGAAALPAAPSRPRDTSVGTGAMPAAAPSSDPKAKLTARRAESRPTAVFERAHAMAEAENPPVAVTLGRPQPRPKNFAPAVTAALVAARASEPAPVIASPVAAPVATPAAPAPTPRTVVAARPTIENSRAAASAEADMDDEPEPKAVAPRIPTSASVAKQATLTRAMNLRDVNLIGVYGTASNRRALVRLPNGRVQQVKVGDRLDGGQVAAIGANQLHYVKSGRSIVLALPKT